MMPILSHFWCKNEQIFGQKDFLKYFQTLCDSNPLKERLLIFLKKTLRCLRFWHQRNWWVTLCWAHTSSHELQRAEGKRFEPCLRPSWVQLLYSQHQCRASGREPRRVIRCFAWWIYETYLFLQLAFYLLDGVQARARADHQKWKWTELISNHNGHVIIRLKPHFITNGSHKYNK